MEEKRKKMLKKKVSNDFLPLELLGGENYLQVAIRNQKDQAFTVLFQLFGFESESVYDRSLMIPLETFSISPS